MKAFRMKLVFRLSAIWDIIFAEKFELKIYKDGLKVMDTKFDKKEIEESDLSTTISDTGVTPQCNSNIWTLNEIIDELKSIDAFDSAKYFFDKYGS